MLPIERNSLRPQLFPLQLAIYVPSLSGNVEMSRRIVGSKLSAKQALACLLTIPDDLTAFGY